MDRIQLLTAIESDPPEPGEVVYLERHGDDYDWCTLGAGAALPAPGGGDSAPEAWLFYSGSWPHDDRARLADHLDDLLAEMDSMSGGMDRCRWPLDAPYPLSH